MENATKALLIAAAVLIAIVLIAVGVKIVSSTQDTSKHATEVGDSINEGTDKAVGDIISGLGGTQKEELRKLLVNELGKAESSVDNILSQYADNAKIEVYIYKGIKTEIPSTFNDIKSAIESNTGNKYVKLQKWNKVAVEKELGTSTVNIRPKGNATSNANEVVCIIYKTS